MYVPIWSIILPSLDSDIGTIWYDRNCCSWNSLFLFNSNTMWSASIIIIIILCLYHSVECILKENVIKSLLKWKHDLKSLGQVSQKKKCLGEYSILGVGSQVVWKIFTATWLTFFFTAILTSLKQDVSTWCSAHDLHYCKLIIIVYCLNLSVWRQF